MKQKVNLNGKEIKKKILNTILQAVKEVNEQFPEDKQLEQSAKTVIFGKGGQLDSLGLVTLLVIIEQKIEDVFDVSITIADERAMSQKRSPFRTIGALADYIDALLKEMKYSS